MPRMRGNSSSRRPGMLGSLGGGSTDPKADDPQPAAVATTSAPAPAAKVPATTTTASVAPKTTAQPKPTQPAAPKVACADQEDRSAPCPVKVGTAFRLGSHTVLDGWKIKDSGFGMTIVGKAKNTDDKASTMFVRLKFLKGTRCWRTSCATPGTSSPGRPKQ